MRATLPKTTMASDALELIRAKVIRGLSVEMIVEGETWDGMRPDHHRRAHDRRCPGRYASLSRKPARSTMEGGASASADRHGVPIFNRSVGAQGACPSTRCAL